MEPTSVELSVVIPVFNEEQALARFLDALRPVLAGLQMSHEVIAVDDGSSDRTWATIRDVSAAWPMLKALRFTRNFGKEAALLAGLQQARGAAVICMDGDGQHPPELIPRLVRAWREEGYEMVCAQKVSRGDSALSRWSARIFANVLRTLSGLELAQASDYRLLARNVADAVINLPERVRFFRGMTEWTGYRSTSIPFDVAPRIGGSSHWTTRSKIRLALGAIISYSAKPLKALAYAGLGGLLISVVLGLQAVYSRFAGIAVSGWTSLTLAVLFFGSANMFGLGLIGMYLAQLFDEIKGRPVYLVAERLEPAKPSV